MTAGQDALGETSVGAGGRRRDRGRAGCLDGHPRGRRACLRACACQTPCGGGPSPRRPRRRRRERRRRWCCCRGRAGAVAVGGRWFGAVQRFVCERPAGLATRKWVAQVAASLAARDLSSPPDDDRVLVRFDVHPASRAVNSGAQIAPMASRIGKKSQCARLGGRIGPSSRSDREKFRSPQWASFGGKFSRSGGAHAPTPRHA